MRSVGSIVKVGFGFAGFICDGGEAFIAVKITVSAVRTDLRLFLVVLP
jgi:L-cysteine desulfidase